MACSPTISRAALLVPNHSAATVRKKMALLKSVTLVKRVMSPRQAGSTGLPAFIAAASTPWRSCWHHRLGIFAGSEKTTARSTPMMGACARRMAVPAVSRFFTVA